MRSAGMLPAQVSELERQSPLAKELGRILIPVDETGQIWRIALDGNDDLLQVLSLHGREQGQDERGHLENLLHRLATRLVSGKSKAITTTPTHAPIIIITSGSIQAASASMR